MSENQVFLIIVSIIFFVAFIVSVSVYRHCFNVKLRSLFSLPLTISISVLIYFLKDQKDIFPEWLQVIFVIALGFFLVLTLRFLFIFIGESWEEWREIRKKRLDDLEMEPMSE